MSFRERKSRPNSNLEWWKCVERTWCGLGYKDSSVEVTYRPELNITTMRPNVAISGLLACSIGISAAPNDGPGLTVPRPNSIVTIQYSETPLPNPPVIPRSSSLAFEFTTDGATINTVKLKIYDSTGRDNGNGDDDQTIANVTFPTFVSTSGPDRNVMLNLDERGTGIVPMLLSKLFLVQSNWGKHANEYV